MTIRLLTRDIAIAIRDHIEGRLALHFIENDKGDIEETEEGADFNFVDVSDPDNPVIHLDNGQTFTVRIFAGDPPSAS